MLCGNCKKNQATKTYEQLKNGKKTVRYYCLDCYHERFLDGNTEKEVADLDTLVCPYCGTSAEEVKKRKLVGCAMCYDALESALFPMVVKMQGVDVHNGKKPLGGEMDKTSRRVYELKTVIDKLNADGDFERAKEYTKRLKELQNGCDEEDFIWRKRPHLYKRS
jgi:protein-arginine kinase activator protein McsA